MQIETAFPVYSLPEMQISSMSGVLSDPDRYWNLSHSSELPSSATVAEVVDSSGEWTAMAESSENGLRKFLFFGDQSGFAPLFYAFLPGQALIVSDTFSGAVHGVQRLGGKISLNTQNYLVNISGKDSTFHNLVSTETMANEINLLPYDQALFVDNDSVSFFARSALSSAHQITSYAEALDRGIETAAQTIERIVNANADASLAITLTGGADSRMVLAILLKTGLAKNFGLWTIDPRDRKSEYQKKVFTADVEIANQLRQHYGMAWSQPFIRDKVALSYEESLAFHQSFNSNFAYTFKPSNALASNVEPVVTLRGGGGEILRGSGGARIYSRRYEKFIAEGGTERASVWLAEEYLKGSFTTQETQTAAVDFLSRVLMSQPGNTLRECIDNYYRSTRNRGHFGHIRKSAATNDRLLQVLTNPYLIRAMELQGYGDRISGQLVMDLLDRTSPELRDFPFENAETDKQLRRSSAESYEYRARHAWKTAFDKRGKPSRSVGYRSLWEPGNRGELKTQKAIGEQDAEFVRSGLARLLDTLPKEERSLVEEQQKLTLQHYSQGSLGVGTLSAKVASALEIFSPMPLDGVGNHYYTDPQRSQRIKSSGFMQRRASGYLLR